MKNKKKSGNKRLDFLSNRANKYSIRRFTVGTASILIGTTLIFGINNDVEASELTDSSINTHNDSEQDDVDPENNLNDPNNNSSIQNSALEANNQSENLDTSNSRESQSAEVSDEANGEKESSEIIKEPKEEQQDSDVLEEGKNTSGKELSGDESKDLTDTTGSENDGDITDQLDKPQSNTINDTSLVEKPSAPIGGEVAQPKGETGNETGKDENKSIELDQLKNTIQSSESNDTKIEASKEYLTNYSNLTLEEIDDLFKDLDVDLTQAANQDILYSLVQDFVNKENIITPEVTNTNYRRTALTNEDSISFYNAKPSGKALFATQTGTNVNELVKISNVDISIQPPHTNPNTGQEEFWATTNAVLRLKADYQLDDSIKEGDTFTIKYGQYFRPGGLNLPSTNHILYTNDGSIIAKGIYNPNTKETTYTFTNYVDQYQNIKGSFNITTFSDKKYATTDKTAYPMEVTIANTKYSEPIIVDYGNKEESVLISSTEHIAATGGDRHMTIYLNQPGKRLYSGVLTVNLSEFTFDKANGNFKIYEVSNDNQFVDSFSPDVSKLKDVTNNFRVNYISDSKAQIDFGRNLLNGKKYIIQHVVEPDTQSIQSNGKVSYNLSGLNINNGRYSYDHNNNYVVYSSDSTASGNNPLYSLGDYVWEDSNRDGKQDTNEKPINGVIVILKDGNGKEIDRTTTNNEGKYQFDNLSNGKYVVEFIPPNGYEPTVANANGISDELDSDGRIVNATINNANNMTIDSGFYKPTYKLGDYVWED
ncbi:YSIRK signal domain/LPXTG anchor domain surface protein, partial [Staphylococcus felis]